MRTAVAAAALVSLTLSGCVVAPQGFTHPGVPGITVVVATDAKLAGLEGRRFTIALPVELDRDAALKRFLRAAHREGAAFVSDLAVAAVAEQEDGRWQRCVTRVQPVDHGHNETTTVVEPDRTVSHVEWQTVSRQVTEPRESCHRVTDGNRAGSTDCVTEYVPHTVESTEQVKVEETIPGGVREQATWVADWKLDAAPAACAWVAAGVPTKLVYATIYDVR
jgi:hypothetical protein